MNWRVVGVSGFAAGFWVSRNAKIAKKTRLEWWMSWILGQTVNYSGDSVFDEDGVEVDEQTETLVGEAEIG